MYFDFRILFVRGVVFGVLLTLAVWGLWSLADLFIDVSISLSMS